MTLIASISGIRGTLGGVAGNALTPPDILRFTTGYARYLQATNPPDTRLKVVVGRDARPSGPMVQALVMATLNSLGIDVIDAGLSTTPTVEMGVVFESAHGGIIITASHNPVQWNALKLLNNHGEFLDAAAGAEVLRLGSDVAVSFAPVDRLGKVKVTDNLLDRHIEAILNHPFVDREAIQQAQFKICVDAVNSSGGIAIPRLLNRLGVNDIVELFCTPNGDFPHNPEPLPEHLTELVSRVRETGCHLGIVVDPDVDRLAFVCEDGSMFGEEYTLVAVADYVLSQSPGNTVSNLSSTRALRDVTRKHGGSYTASAVGEVNVVTAMKATQAVIGGEGNGGIIDPQLHYGRDALVGVALFLTHLAKAKMSASQLRATYPQYYMSKNKMDLRAGMDVDSLLEHVAAAYAHEEVNTADGVKIDFKEGWVHLRKSNTEPIVRIYSEAASPQAANELAHAVIKQIEALVS